MLRLLREMGLRSKTCVGGALVGVALASACTEVREQPQAPVAVAPEPAPAKPTRPARPPVQRTPWPTNPDDAAVAARRAAEARAAAAAAEAEAAAKNALPREKLQKILDEALPTLTPCWSGETSLSTTISFEVTGNGRAENVRMPNAPAAAAGCVADKLRALPLPSYAGPVVSITIPVSVTSSVRPGGTAPVANAPAAPAAPAPAPKLFVNP